jgi:hypothetical protein
MVLLGPIPTGAGGTDSGDFNPIFLHPNRAGSGLLYYIMFQTHVGADRQNHTFGRFSQVRVNDADNWSASVCTKGGDSMDKCPPGV